MAPPPGYVAYGGTNQGAFGSFRRIGGLATWLQVAAGAMILVQGLALLLVGTERNKAVDYVEGRISEDEFVNSVGLSALVGILTFLALVAMAVLTIIWMFRMAKNAELMQRIGTWKPGWAIAGWFTPPLVLYVVPFLMLRDLWKASDPESGHDWRQNRVGGIVGIWWVLYGLVPLLFLGVTLSSLEIGQSTEDAARDIADNYGITLASGAVQLAAAAAFLVLVRQLTARHRRTVNEA